VAGRDLRGVCRRRADPAASTATAHVPDWHLVRPRVCGLQRSLSRVALATVATPLERSLTAALGRVNLHIHVGVAQGWPLAAQFVLAFVGLDLVQWGIHNLLHRAPWLWQLHKVHHSIEELDWLGSMRFHWGEVVVYKTLQYLPLAFLGFDGRVLFAVAIVGTIIGHFNHSNLAIDLGPLKYVVNSPEMHQWHHVHPDAGPVNKNFGINLALWDWLFQTAYLPANVPADVAAEKAAPTRLGFADIERFPRSIVLQDAWPLSALLPRRR
jgi:sterol desaturase/sphingolipid hydroxylase (fatty acid hydroxylase superfamily)